MFLRYVYRCIHNVKIIYLAGYVAEETDIVVIGADLERGDGISFTLEGGVEGVLCGSDGNPFVEAEVDIRIEVEYLIRGNDALVHEGCKTCELLGGLDGKDDGVCAIPFGVGGDILGYFFHRAVNAGRTVESVRRNSGDVVVIGVAAVGAGVLGVTLARAGRGEGLALVGVRQLACDGVGVSVATLGTCVSGVTILKTGGRGYHALIEVSELRDRILSVIVRTL